MTPMSCCANRSGAASVKNSVIRWMRMLGPLFDPLDAEYITSNRREQAALIITSIANFHLVYQTVPFPISDTF
jgi:hypothetical protein